MCFVPTLNSLLKPVRQPPSVCIGGGKKEFVEVIELFIAQLLPLYVADLEISPPECPYSSIYCLLECKDDKKVVKIKLNSYKQDSLQRSIES